MKTSNGKLKSIINYIENIKTPTITPIKHREKTTIVSNLTTLIVLNNKSLSPHKTKTKSQYSTNEYIFVYVTYPPRNGGVLDYDETLFFARHRFVRCYVKRQDLTTFTKNTVHPSQTISFFNKTNTKTSSIQIRSWYMERDKDRRLS